MLADDNSDMRSYVSDWLGRLYDIEAVSDGQFALEAARREPPALIISDVMMPRLDGLGLLQALRADRNLREVPVILLSARAGEEARIEGLSTGADDYIIKPFTGRELLARVGALLELAYTRRQSEERRRRELEEALRQKDEFLAMLAHELRNPLAPIRNAGELLSRSLPADAPMRSRRSTSSSARSTHLTRLVDDLLDVSRITQGRIELRRRPTSVADLVAAVARDGRPADPPQAAPGVDRGQSLEPVRGRRSGKTGAVPVERADQRGQVHRSPAAISASRRETPAAK